MKVSSSSIFKSSYKPGSFNIDPNKIIPLLFSLDKNMLYFVNYWNEKVYSLFRTVMQEKIDFDAWKDGLNASTIPLTLDPIKSRNWWNDKKERPYSIFESIEKISEHLAKSEKILEEIKTPANIVLERYLYNKFSSLLDTPASYLPESLASYDLQKKEIVWTPFANIGISPPSTFVSLDDAAGLDLNKILTVEDSSSPSSVVWRGQGYPARSKIISVSAGTTNLGTLSGDNYVLVCDTSGGDVTLALNTNSSPLETSFSIVTPAFTNNVILDPGDCTFEGSTSNFTITTSPFRIVLSGGASSSSSSFLNYLQIGEHQ